MSIKNQIIKSVCALLCVAALCVTTVASTNRYIDAIKNSSSGTAADVAVDDADTDAVITDDETSDDSVVTDDAEENTSEETTDEAANDSSAEETTEQAETGKTETKPAGNSSSTQTKTTAKSSVPSTKAEIVNYCNKALNNAKAAKAGYTKTFVRASEGNLPGLVAKVVSQNKTTTMKKGGDNKEDFPAAGYSWSSKLRDVDVKDAKIKVNGQYYEITLTLDNEKNPGKGESSRHGRVMSVITEADAKDMLSAVKTANFVYHDGYVYAKIDSKTGRLVKAEFSATADISATLAVLGELNASNIKSTETLTNFVW